MKPDGWSGYKALPRHGYKHSPVSIRASSDPAHVVMPAVRRRACLLKRWWLGTHQGAVSHEHFDYYLDEYTFRFNLGSSQSRGLLSTACSKMRCLPHRHRNQDGRWQALTTACSGHLLEVDRPYPLFVLRMAMMVTRKTLSCVT